MSRSLWLLLGLQLRGWVRNVVRSLGTVKGALLAAVGLGVFLLWFSYLILATAGPQDRSEQIRIWGPAGLLLYCVLNVLSTPAEKAIYFSPGEVNFLFPAPFGRRELLAYKLMLGFLFSLPTTLFMTFVLHIYAFSFLSAFVGLLLTYQFMQLFANAVNLLASTGGGRALALLRAAVVGAAAALALGVAWRAGLLGRPATSATWPGALSKRTFGRRFRARCSTFSRPSCPASRGRSWRGTRAGCWPLTWCCWSWCSAWTRTTWRRRRRPAPASTRGCGGCGAWGRPAVGAPWRW